MTPVKKKPTARTKVRLAYDAVVNAHGPLEKQRKLRVFRAIAMKAVIVLAVNVNAAILPADRSFDWGGWVWRPPTTPRPTHVIYTTAMNPNVATLNAAIASCPAGSVIEFEGGTYAMNGEIQFARNGVTVRGMAGHRVVFSNAGGAASSMVRFRSGYPDDLGSGQNVDVGDVSTVSKGSTSFSTVGVPSGIAAGDIIQIDQLEDDPLGWVDANGNSGHCNWCARASGNRPFSQTLRVLSVNGTVINFEPPLALNFQPSQQPQIVEHRNVIKNSGLENIVLVNSGSRDTIVMHGAWECFIKDCELYNSVRRHVWMFGGGRVAFTGSSFRNGNGADWSSAYTSDRAYGVFVGQHTSYTLIENCIFEKLSYAIALEGASMGTVIGYNFCTNIQNNTHDTPKPFTGNHGAHPAMVLCEGNWSAARYSMDRYWGSASHWTFLRNRAFIVTPQANGVPVSQYWVVFDIWKDNIYLSVLGNLFGRSGVENQMEVPNGASVNTGSNVKAIRRSGTPNANSTSWSGYDPQVAATLLWHGNWLAFPVGVQYDPAIVDHNIPNSLYLNSKPEFQGALEWPPYDPMNPTANSPLRLAAGYRFYYGTNPPSSTAPVHQPPSQSAFVSGRVRLQ